MNHCLLEVKVKETPTIRYTQDNKVAIAEMEVLFKGLRNEDPLGVLKVIGWGNMAQDLQNNIHVGQKLILEGRLRMNTVPRQDGTKEKKAEFTLSKFHIVSNSLEKNSSPVNPQAELSNKKAQPSPGQTESTNPDKDFVNWDSSPLIPETDEIPF